MQSVLFYKVALLVLLAGASGTTATVAFYYRGRENDLGSQVANLGTRNDSQNSEISSLKRELDNLTGQISQLNIQIGQLNTANFQLGNLIAQLRAQLANGLCSSGRTVTIGELVDLSSALSTQGVRAKDASLLATNDINSFLSTAGCNLRFAVAVDDYQLDNSIALSELQSLAAAGVQVVVGPLNSGAAQYLLSYANSNHIVLISPSSTSRVLAIPNDYLFRTAPNDGVQGLADARMMIDRGATALIIVQRHDSYGDTLANATAKNFEALGGVVGATIQYDASGGTGFDFTSVLQTLNNDFQTANTGAYANKVAMDFISFEEFGQLIIQANAKYPALLNGPLPWFGTDGDAQDTVISGNATAGPLAAQVKLPSTLYFPVSNAKTQALDSKFAAAYPGNVCESYCLGAYDDVWLAVLATLQAGSYDGVKIQSILPTVASNYYGVEGWLGLDSSGDRATSASSYQIWKVVSQSGAPTWILAGTWDGSSDTITWVSPP